MASPIFTKPNLHLHCIEDWESTQGDFSLVLSETLRKSRRKDDTVILILGDQIEIRRETWIERIKAFSKYHAVQEWYRKEVSGTTNYLHFGGKVTSSLFVTNQPMRLSRKHQIHSMHVVQLPDERDTLQFLLGLANAAKASQIGQPNVQIDLHLYIDPKNEQSLNVLSQWMLDSGMKKMMPMWMRLGKFKQVGQRPPPCFNVMQQFLTEENSRR
ncbi:unnamed protein product [Sphagnum tenellum]